jgi:acyl carrier protein
MDQAMIAAEVEALVRSNFKIDDDDEDFDHDVHLFDYGYIDSFGAVELTTFVEEKCGIEISNTDLVIHPLNTISEIASFAARRREGKI